MRKKTLVCILAETRAYKLTWSHFKRNLIDALDADLALCISVPHDYEFSNPFWQFAQYKWDVPEYGDWGQAFDEARADLLAPSERPVGDDWRLLLDVGDQWLGGVKAENQHPGSAGILIFFRWLLLQRILQENLHIKYDRFVITRSDFLWENPHPDLKVLDEAFIWIPDGEGYGGVTDRHVVLNRDDLQNYLNLLEEILLRPQELKRAMEGRTDWNLEKFIYLMLGKTGCASRLRYFPYCMYSVRESNGSTSWSKGVWSDELGFYIKYPAEQDASKSVSRLLTNRNWHDLIHGHESCGFNARVLSGQQLIAVSGNELHPIQFDATPAPMLGLHIDFNDGSARLYLGAYHMGLYDRIFVEDVRLIPADAHGVYFQSVGEGLFYHLNKEGALAKSTDERTPFTLQNRYAPAADSRPRLEINFDC